MISEALYFHNVAQLRQHLCNTFFAYSGVLKTAHSHRIVQIEPGSFALSPLEEIFVVWIEQAEIKPKCFSDVGSKAVGVQRYQTGILQILTDGTL